MQISPTLKVKWESRVSPRSPSQPMQLTATPTGRPSASVTVVLN